MAIFVLQNAMVKTMKNWMEVKLLRKLCGGERFTYIELYLPRYRMDSDDPVA